MLYSVYYTLYNIHYILYNLIMYANYKQIVMFKLNAYIF